MRELVNVSKYLLVLVNKSLVKCTFLYSGIVVYESLQRLELSLHGVLLVMDAWVAVLRCFTLSCVDGCSAVLYYTLFCPAVLCQYGLANRLWLTGDCVG